MKKLTCTIPTVAKAFCMNGKHRHQRENVSGGKRENIDFTTWRSICPSVSVTLWFPKVFQNKGSEDFKVLHTSSGSTNLKKCPLTSPSPSVSFYKLTCSKDRLKPMGIQASAPKARSLEGRGGGLNPWSTARSSQGWLHPGIQTHP